jgi:FO synthase
VSVLQASSLDRETADGRRLDREEALALVHDANVADLARAAERVRDFGHGNIVSYSRKVFIPLTHLCRDVCHYCTFAEPPRRRESAFMSADEVLAVARAGAAAGCREALFTLGDKPELRYRAAREALEALGHATTLSYLKEMASLVHAETGLLPHLNAGVMDEQELRDLRGVSVSQGLMLESVSERLCKRGGPHFGSPDKRPGVRLATLEAAGRVAIPMTTGILIGIGETREERIDTLLAIRDVHDRFGHIQEVIVQNFRAKPGTRMAAASEPGRDELMWTIAMARLILGSSMNIQAPPNLSPGGSADLVRAGINDWGGVSPVTPDFVNPEAPWPHLATLRRDTELAGKELVERLALYPSYVNDPDRWVDAGLRTSVVRSVDASGWARTDDWSPGGAVPPPRATDDHGFRAKPERAVPGVRPSGRIGTIIDRAASGRGLDEHEIVALFDARGPDFLEVCRAADSLRADTVGDTVTYVVNRNINYTNVCSFRCQFCAFSKGRLSENLRGEPYVVDRAEIARRAREAWERGASEVCMQGGIHPEYTGQTYVDACRTVHEAVPGMHIHAFSPLEVWQGARTLGKSIDSFLADLKQAGLGTLPGTAAEILDDEVRRVICPDKVSTDEWLSVMRAAHRAGLRSTATIMFGHVDRPSHWARHLRRVRALQEETGGFTEFVPLPFVHMEAPIYLKGRARRGPTWREAVLMHAVARLALHPVVPNIQVSWVKMGMDGAKYCLDTGANDLGGTLMNESISRAAGASHGQEMSPQAFASMASEIGRPVRRRTTLYGQVEPDQLAGSDYGSKELAPLQTTSARDYARRSGRRGARERDVRP